MSNLSKKNRWLLTILSGVLMGIAFPYTGSMFFLGFIALVPLMLVEHFISAKNYRSRKVFVHAYTSFFLYNLITTWWILHASLGGACMAVLANSLLMALTFQLFHLSKKHLGTKEGHIALIILWLGFEYAHFHWEVSWPWLNLGNLFADVPQIVQWYSYSGILGGTLWIILSNILIFRIARNLWFKKESFKIQTPLIFGIGLCLIVPIAISIGMFFNYEEKGIEKKILAMQPNMDAYTEKFRISNQAHAEILTEDADKNGANSCDLILAPETAIPFSFGEDEARNHAFYHILQNRVDAWKTPFLIGTSTQQFFLEKNSPASRKLMDGPGYIEHYNSSMMLLPGEKPSFLHKSKLVLGVEKVPFIGLFPFMDELAINLDGTSGTLGIEKEPMIYSSPFPFAPVICYESIYGEFVGEQCEKGAEIIAIITNDGWWQDTPGYRQHFAFARLRAIENRRDVVRSANTGTSGFINQRGDVLVKTAYNEKENVIHTVRLNKKVSFYAKHGDVLGRTSAFVSVFLLFYVFMRRFKAKHKTL